MADNLIYWHIGVTGLAANLSCQLFREGVAVSPTLAVVEIGTTGDYTTTMSGVAGEYSARLLYNNGGTIVSPMYTEGFSWDGVQFVTAASLDLDTIATTDEVESARDAILTQGNSAWTTATGFSTLTAQQVWEYTGRTLDGSQADNLATIPLIPTNPLLAANYTAPDNIGIAAARTAAEASAYGRYVVDYPKAYQYNRNGTLGQEFDLLQSDGTTPATAPSNAVERRPST